jgi:pyruvate formate lyase activating enzyme
MNIMNIAGMAKSSLIDYPGLVSCVLFVPGCNYSCYYCHNRSLLDGPYRIMPVETVVAFLKSRTGLLDAVVISGGEPTLQEGLAGFMEIAAGLGFKLKLDTNGSRPDVVERLSDQGLLDYCAVDYKAPSCRYKEICGGAAEIEQVQKTIDLLLRRGIPFEVRTTVLPLLSQDDLVQMAKELPLLPRYVLNRYRRPEKYLPRDREKVDIEPYTRELMESIAQLVAAYQPNVSL